MVRALRQYEGLWKIIKKQWLEHKAFAKNEAVWIKLRQADFKKVRKAISKEKDMDTTFSPKSFLKLNFVVVERHPTEVLYKGEIAVQIWLSTYRKSRLAAKVLREAPVPEKKS